MNKTTRMKKTPITIDQRNKLLAAIYLAQNPQGCDYVNWDKGLASGPQCVIGQLAYLSGVSLPDLAKWSGVVSVIFMRTKEGSEILKQYPIQLLMKLQGIWDGGKLRSVKTTSNVVEYVLSDKVLRDYNKIKGDVDEIRRQAMVDLVLKWPVKKN